MIMTDVILNVFLISDWKNFTEIFTSMFIRKYGLYCALIPIRSSQPGVSLSHVGIRLVMILYHLMGRVTYLFFLEILSTLMLAPL